MPIEKKISTEKQKQSYHQLLIETEERLLNIPGMSEGVK